MAIQWGNWVGNFPKQMRIGIEYTSVPIPSAGQTQVLVKATIWLGAYYWFFDNTNSLVWSGDLGSGSSSQYVSVGSNSSIPIRYIQKYVSTSTSDRLISVDASFTGIDYIGGFTARVTGSHILKARPSTPPGVPTNPRWSWDGTAFTVRWGAPTDTTNPPDYYRLQQSVNGGSWATIYSGSSTVFGVPITVPNSRYRWRIQSVNKYGPSGYVYTEYGYTTPERPGNVIASRTGVEGQVILTWNNTAPYADRIQIGYSDGSEWVVLGSNFSPTLDTYTINGLSVDTTHQFYVAYFVNPPSLGSGWSRSNIVQLLAPPEAPTELSPNGGYYDANEDSIFSWRHNPVDSSDQTGFILSYSTDNWVTSTEIEVSSSQSSYTIPAGTVSNGDTVQWKVKTRGEDPDYSPWSAVASFSTSNAPIITITSPEDGTSLAGNMVELSWAFYDADGNTQQSWLAKLFDANTNELMETASGTTEDAHTFSSILINNSNYRIELWANDDLGMRTNTEVSNVVTDFIGPEKPILTAVWVDELSAVNLVVTNPPSSSPDVPDASYNVLQRSFDNGQTWETLVTPWAINGTYVDYTPSLSGLTWYRVIAMSNLPSSTESNEEVVRGQGTGAWIYSPSTGAVAALDCSIESSGDYTTPVTLHRFLGESYPTAIYALNRQPTESYSVAGTIGHYKPCVDVVSSSTDIEELFKSITTAPVIYRDEFGRSFLGAITGLTYNPQYYTASVSFTISRVTE